MVRPLATNPAQNLFFLSFTSAEGKGAPLPFGWNWPERKYYLELR